MVEDHKIFDKVYNSLVKTLSTKVKQNLNYRKLGMPIDYNKVKLLNLYIVYLESIKNSKYKYFYIKNLTNISNYLNKI